MPARSFHIVREGDDDPSVLPEPVDERPILAWIVDGTEVTEDEYNAAHAEWHAL